MPEIDVARDAEIDRGVVSDAAAPAEPSVTEADTGVRDAPDGGANPDAPDAAGGAVSDASTGGIVAPEPEPEPQPDEDAGVPGEPEIPCGDLSGVESPDGHCYFALSMLQTWFVARDRCIQLGADLATITSQQEQAFVAPLVVASPHWIGLARFGSRFTWHSGELFAFDNFATGEPNGEGEVGVVFGNLSGTWFDTNVRDTFPAMCERE